MTARRTPATYREDRPMTLPRGAYYENGHPVDPATPKFTDAEIAKLAAIEAAPAAEESVRERLENALAVELDSLGLTGEISARACIYLADAAIAVLRGPSSDAEQAVELVTALCDDIDRYQDAPPPAERGWQTPAMRHVRDYLRAAVAGD